MEVTNALNSSALSKLLPRKIGSLPKTATPSSTKDAIFFNTLSDITLVFSPNIKIEYFRPEGANKHFLSILISCTNPYGSIKSYSYPAGMSGRVCAYKPVIQLSSP